MFDCDRLSFFEASDDGFLSASQLALGAWPSEARSSEASPNQYWEAASFPFVFDVFCLSFCFLGC